MVINMTPRESIIRCLNTFCMFFCVVLLEEIFVGTNRTYSMISCVVCLIGIMVYLRMSNKSLEGLGLIFSGKKVLKGLLIAAITAIDPCLYEAASIDGAGRLQKIKYITLPGIKPTFMILLLINIGNILNAGFEVQYLLGNGLVKRVSDTIDIFVLKWGISQNDFSLGTAAGIFKSVISITLILIFNYIAKRNGDERLF